MPSTWRDIITCFRFNRAGSAAHPVLVTTVNGESFVIPKMLQASFRNVSAACERIYKWILYNIHKHKCDAISIRTSIIRLGPQKPRYGEFSNPTLTYSNVPISNWKSFSNLSTNFEICFRAYSMASIGEPPRFSAPNFCARNKWHEMTASNDNDNVMQFNLPARMRFDAV